MATQVNRVGADWLLIRKWINDKIDEHTQALTLTNENGDIRRGHIAALKEMVAWVEPSELPEVTTDTYDR